MKTRHLLLMLPLLAATLLAQDKGEKPKVTKSKSGILILNLSRAIDDSDEGRDILARLKEEEATKKQRLTEEVAKLQEKVKVLRDAKAADRTPEYYKDLEQAMDTAARLEMEKNIFLAKKGDERNRIMQQLLIGAQQEARDIMKERGAEIVLVTKTGPIEFATDQDVQQEFIMRRVLCADESIDITGEVIARMNKWYKEHRSSKGVPEREPAKGAAPKEGAAKETPPKGAEMKANTEKSGS